MSDRPYLFYGADISYFSAKVRPALRTKGVRHAEVLPDYADIKRRTGLHYIPVVVTPTDETWQDTSTILDHLAAAHPEPPPFPTTPVQRVVAYLFELYADEFMLLPAMHYRWNFEESELKARSDFAALQDDAARAHRFAETMKGTLPMLGVRDDTIVPIATHLDDLLTALETHFEEHGYLLGERPSLADCALMGPMYAHLYLDAVPGRILHEYHRVANWIERMNHPVPGAKGKWLARDALAPTLRPVLKLIGRDAVPWVLDGVKAIERWAKAGIPADRRPPRIVGTTTSSLRGHEAERGVQAYTLWMAQRPIDAYRALSASARKKVDEALAGTGGEKLLACEPRVRLAKEGFELVVAAD